MPMAFGSPILQSPAKDFDHDWPAEITSPFRHPGGGPSLGAEPDPHAGHHPAEAAKAAPPAVKTAPDKPVMKGCPMMAGKMAAGSGPMAGAAPDGKMMDGKMMMDGKDMHCMAEPTPAKPAGAPQDHEHPDATAPK